MMQTTVQNIVKPYKEMVIDSSKLEVPRNTYQRDQKLRQIKDISKDFDERVANEPKVSYRDGRYFVFDGQHTIAARVHRNGGDPLPILCKVYFGMTEKEEALIVFHAGQGSGKAQNESRNAHRVSCFLFSNSLQIRSYSGSSSV